MGKENGQIDFEIIYKEDVCISGDYRFFWKNFWKYVLNNIRFCDRYY